MSSPAPNESPTSTASPTRRAKKAATSRVGLFGTGAALAVVAIVISLLSYSSVTAQPAGATPGDMGFLRDGGLHGYTSTLKLPEGEEREVEPGIMTLTVNGQDLDTYCLQVRIEAKYDQEYTEKPWSETSVKNESKVHWILQNGYGQLEGSTLLAAAGVAPVGPIADKTIAMTATQAAIWHYTDGIEPVKFGGLHDKQVKGVYQYLVQGAKSGANPAPVTPTIAIAPGATSLNGVLGPITVKTTDGSAAALKIEPGAQAQYVKGGPVDMGSVRSGEPFNIVGAPASGSYTLTATGTGTLQSGRVFTLKNAQTIVTAGSGATITRTARAVLSWSPAPAPTTPGPKPPAPKPTKTKPVPTKTEPRPTPTTPPAPSTTTAPAPAPTTTAPEPPPTSSTSAPTPSGTTAPEPSTTSTDEPSGSTTDPTSTDEPSGSSTDPSAGSTTDPTSTEDPTSTDEPSDSAADPSAGTTGTVPTRGPVETAPATRPGEAPAGPRQSDGPGGLPQADAGSNVTLSPAGSWVGGPTDQAPARDESSSGADLPPMAQTGVAVASLLSLALLLMGGGYLLMLFKPRGRHAAPTAKK